MALQLPDVVSAFIVLVGIVLLAPFFVTTTDMVSSSADPFSSLLLQLMLPLIVLFLLVSIGVAARGSS